MRAAFAATIALASLLACSQGVDVTTLLNVRGDGTTGLVGTVRRGPITPVCQVGVPCDAPFSAGFEVLLGQIAVARFQSDSAGRYQVLLAPGTYVVVPDSSAPIFPKGQTRQVNVGPVGLTQLDLEFDTGIR